jgi:hypothetical protein
LKRPQPPPPTLELLPATPEEIAAANAINQKKSNDKAARLNRLKPYLFKKGQTPPRSNARNRLQGSFISALANDFDIHGKEAIQRARAIDPMGYVRVIASLMPKQIEQATPLEELTDDELAAGIEHLRSRLSVGVDEGNGKAAKPKSITKLRTIPETT